MIIESDKEVTIPDHNTVVGDIIYENSKVVFKGKNNILYTDGQVTLTNSNITFCGDDAVVYLSGNGRRPYSLRLDMWRGTAAYFGLDNYFNGALNAVISERKNLVIGSGGMFSFGIWLRTADPHIIYSADTHRRINPSKSILIGDHVWLGQNALILKGSAVGSGSIVSANCVVAGKRVGSNTIYAGNPCRLVKEKVFFTGDSVHNYTKAKTKKSQQNESEKFIYNNSNAICWEELDGKLCGAEAAGDKLVIIQQYIAQNTEKNRFYIKQEQQSNSLLSRLKSIV